MPRFSHCHQLSIVGDKDSEIARQRYLYLYGGTYCHYGRTTSQWAWSRSWPRLGLRLGLGIRLGLGYVRDHAYRGVVLP